MGVVCVCVRVRVRTKTTVFFFFFGAWSSYIFFLVPSTISGVVDDRAMTYQHIMLSHVPQTADMCLPANPALPAFEFYGLQTEVKGQKVKVASNSILWQGTIL